MGGCLCCFFVRNANEEISDKSTEEDEEITVEKSNLWSSIPRELASLILCHMSYKDQFTFRATCKSWGSISGFHKQHRPPLMLALHNNKYHIFNPLHNAYHQNPIQQLPPAKILYSRFGWLLMAKILGYRRNFFFFNISTKTTLDLPDFPTSLRVDWFSFSSPPTTTSSSSSNCFVVGINMRLDKSVFIYLTKPGEIKWTTLEVFVEIPEVFVCLYPPFFHKEEFYCLDLRGLLAIFDPHHPNESWRICGEPFCKLKARDTDIFLLQSDDDGELLCVKIWKLGKVCIYKFHSSTMEWTKIKNLDDKILYLCNAGSFMETTKFKGMGNRIYSPKFQDGLMMFYSLDTKTYHSYGLDLSSDSVCDFSESIYSTWVQPIF